MDVQIGKGLNLRIDGRDTGGGLSIAEDSLGSALETALSATPIYIGSDAAEVSISDPSQGQSQTASNIQAALKTKNDALDAIQTLRDQQLDLVTEAKNTAYGERSTDLKTQSDAISTEISAIVGRATFNGQQVVNSSQLYTYDEYHYSEDFTVTRVSDAIGVGGLQTGSSTVIGTLPQSGFDQTNATTNETFLKQSVSALRDFRAGTAAAQDKGNTLDPPETRDQLAEGLSLSPATIVDAQELSRRIANSLSSPYAKESQTLALIDSIAGGLDEERVSKLLEEA